MKFILAASIFFISPLMVSSQYHPEDGRSREEFLADLIQRLDSAKAVKDTATIVESLATLAINFQSARMHERSQTYLREGIKYALAYNVDSVTAKIASMAGYNLMVQMGDTTNKFYYQAKDSALWWFRQQTRLWRSAEGESSKEAGWGYRGMINVYNHHAKATGVVSDSATYYFNAAMKLRRPGSLLEYSARQIYTSYLLHTGQIEKAIEVFSESNQFLPHLNTKQRHGYYSLNFRLIASEKNLDTLAVLYDSALTTFAQVVAATHEEKLYENDQKYEVSKTKEVLGQTEAELSSSRRLLIISIAGIVIFIALSIYLYLLFQKNKKLRDLNANLVREQNHRVKNNLQMLASMIAVQAEKVENEEIKQNLLDNEKRIQSLALLHRRLYDREYINVDVHEYFHELLEELLFSLSAQGIKLKLEVEKLTLPVDTMVHLGLITNELVTNSVKHGFNGKPTHPEINLSFKEGAESYELTYQDNGQGFNGETKAGFGMDLIKSQVKQLRGKYAIDNQAGFRFKLAMDTF